MLGITNLSGSSSGQFLLLIGTGDRGQRSLWTRLGEKVYPIASHHHVTETGIAGSLGQVGIMRILNCLLRSGSSGTLLMTTTDADWETLWWNWASGFGQISADVGCRSGLLFYQGFQIGRNLFLLWPWCHQCLYGHPHEFIL